jgi:hypothetical protein
VPSDAVTRREVKVRIHAWLEEREISGLEPAFRARVEVYEEAAYVPVTGGGGSPAELHGVLDRLLVDAGLVGPGSEGSG